MWNLWALLSGGINGVALALLHIHPLAAAALFLVNSFWPLAILNARTKGEGLWTTKRSR
jgi:hypothetical protein